VWAAQRVWAAAAATGPAGGGGTAAAAKGNGRGDARDPCPALAAFAEFVANNAPVPMLLA